MKHSQNESDKKLIPLVTIGLPVFDSEKTIEAAIESILNQSYQNWELIISDNNSNDQTIKIVEKFLSLDSRIFLYKQKTNIGMYRNYDFVLKKSKGKYFHWLASDDTRSNNFLEENILYLENHSDFIASCSQKYFGSLKKDQKNNINFKIDQDTAQKRINVLIDNIWESHSIYFSVIRTKAIKNCQYLGEHYLAQDWIIDMFLAKHGKIALQKNSYIIIGESGVSKINPFKPFRLMWIEFIIPLYSLHKRFNHLISNFSFLDKITLQKKIIFLHIITIRMSLIRYIKSFLNNN